MSDIVENIKDLPTWLLAILGLGIGFLVLIPVIVILAAVIGTFVLSAGGGSGDLAETPTAQFDYDYNGETNELTVIHAGGDRFDTENVEITVNDESSTDWSGSGEVSAGGTTTVANVSSGDIIRVVWVSDDGGSSHVISDYEVE